MIFCVIEDIQYKLDDIMCSYKHHLSSSISLTVLCVIVDILCHLNDILCYYRNLVST